MVLWWVADIIGAGIVIPLVILLANRVIRPAVEIRRYAEDILEHGVLLTEKLDPVPELLKTRDLVREAANNAVRYLTALEPLI